VEAIAGVVRHKGKGKVPIVSDEVYHSLAFDGDHTATASLTDVPVVTLDGMSKAFYQPGWRCGYALLSNFPDQTLLEALVKVCSFRLSANNPVQHAYAAGLAGREQHQEEFDRLLRTLKERADYTTQRLASIQGISCVPPRGAFYAFPRVEEGIWKDDKQFVTELLTEAGLWVVHGSGFGMDHKKNYFRLVTLPEMETQEEAFDRLDGFMKSKR
jgi:aspartate/methionine/tyrosine aminotransferase